MMNCKMCQKETEAELCSECAKAVNAARAARLALEARINMMEEQIKFLLNFFSIGFPSPIQGAPPRQFTLEEFAGLIIARRMETGESQADARVYVEQHLKGLVNG